MRAIQHEGGLRKSELEAIASGQTALDIDDMEFLETLAQYRCMLMPPWVFHIRPDGKLERLTPVRYLDDYNLDKAAILLALLEKLPRMH
jgi:hypothetical protein